MTSTDRVSAERDGISQNGCFHALQLLFAEAHLIRQMLLEAESLVCVDLHVTNQSCIADFSMWGASLNRRWMHTFIRLYVNIDIYVEDGVTVCPL